MAEDNAAPEGGEKESAPEGGGEKNQLLDKVLNEKKNAMTKLRQLEEENKKLKDAEYERTQNYKKKAEETEKELLTLKEEIKKRDDMIKKTAKENSVKKELTRLGIDQKYLDGATRLINFQNIQMDEETGVVTGADSEAKYIFEQFTPLFKKSGPGVNQDAPSTDGKTLTVEDYKKMSPEEKQKHKKAFYASQGITLRD
jgi:hypothetical protein